MTCNPGYQPSGNSCVPDTVTTQASYSCNTTGTLGNYSIQATEKIISADAGKAGAYFVIGRYNDNWYTYDGNSWTPYNGSNATGFSTQFLGNITSYPLFTNKNFYGLTGVPLYVGYGVGANTTIALNDLLTNNKFSTCGPAFPAPIQASFSCNNSGTASNYNLTANVTVASADSGKAGT
jgi:hypothetical protein